MAKGNRTNHVRGSDHYRWNNGHISSSHGYRKVRVGKSHPLADSNGYAYEHALVWVSARGEVQAGSVIHHLNGDKQDNRLENLSVESRSDHNAHHNSKRRRGQNGRFLPIKKEP